MVLDQKPDLLQQHLATSVYEKCRAGDLQLPSFPDFSGYIQGLKESKPETDEHQYQVCTKRGSNLIVLGALANKWLQSEQFKGDAKAMIENHNSRFNADGDFVEEEAPRLGRVCG